MNVIPDTGVLGQVKNAIDGATSAINRIVLSDAEMDEFLSSPEFKINIDKNYAGYELDVPLRITTTANGIVKSCWYKKTLIVRG